jgi:hypothetical protein
VCPTPEIRKFAPELLDVLAVRTSVPPIVTVWPLVGFPEKFPVCEAVAGALASIEVPLIVIDELALTVPLPTVPMVAKLAALLLPP